MVSVQNLQGWRKFLKFYFLTLLPLLVAAYRGVFRTWSNVTMELFCKNSQRFQVVNYFCRKKLNRRFSTGLKIDFCLRTWNIELTLVPSLQIKPKKYSARKHGWHRFWKGKRLRWDSKHNGCLCWSNRPKRFLKKMLWEISQNSQENICAGISFLVFSCKVYEICKNILFAEQYRTTTSDYNSISSKEGNIG